MISHPPTQETEKLNFYGFPNFFSYFGFHFVLFLSKKRNSDFLMKMWKKIFLNKKHYKFWDVVWESFGYWPFFTKNVSKHHFEQWSPFFINFCSFHIYLSTKCIKQCAKPEFLNKERYFWYFRQNNLVSPI